MKSKLGIIISTLLAYSITSYGQEPGTSTSDPLNDQSLGISNLTTKDAATQAEEYLAEMGWIQGWDERKQRYIAIGVGSIDVPTTHSKFYLARRIAYTKARLSASAQIASYIAAKISRDIENSYEEAAGGDESLEEEIQDAGRKDPRIIDKATMLIYAELDRLLESKGVDPNSKKAVTEVRKLLAQDKFKDAISAVAKAEVCGLLSLRQFEYADARQNNGSTAVIAVVSDQSRRLAGAILGKNPSPLKNAKTSIGEWCRGLDAKALLSTFGTTSRTDENGNLCLISFGQSKPISNTSSAKVRASDKASLVAKGFLRSFAGELVYSDESSDTASNFSELEEELQEFNANDDFFKVTTTKADQLSMPGISTAYTWNRVDPRSGEEIYGVVLNWNLGSAMKANVLRDQMEGLGGSKGGTGVSNIKPTSPLTPSKNSTSSSSSSKGNSFSIRGVITDDDDF
jgi:hypothetical protein